MKTLAAAIAALEVLGLDTLDATGFDVLAGVRTQFDCGHGIDAQARQWAAKADRYRGFKGPKAARRAAAMQAVADTLVGIPDEAEAAPAPRTFVAFISEVGKLPVTLAFESTAEAARIEADRVIAAETGGVAPGAVQIVEVDLYEDRADATAAGVPAARWVLFGAAYCPPGYEVCARIA